MENIVNETKVVIDELLERAKLRRGDICVIGCSTSASQQSLGYRRGSRRKIRL